MDVERTHEINTFAEELMESVRPRWKNLSGRNDFMRSLASVIELVIIGYTSSIRIDMSFRLEPDKAVKAFTTRNLQHTGRAFCLTLSYVETQRDGGKHIED